MPSKTKIRIVKTDFINLQGNVIVCTCPLCTGEDTLRISLTRKCVVSAFGYSGFSVHPNLIDIDGLEEDFTGRGSSGAEGACQSRRLEHL